MHMNVFVEVFWDTRCTVQTTAWEVCMQATCYHNTSRMISCSQRSI